MSLQVLGCFPQEAKHLWAEMKRVWNGRSRSLQFRLKEAIYAHDAHHLSQHCPVGAEPSSAAHTEAIRDLAGRGLSDS
jgi:hypothetical protein